MTGLVKLVIIHDGGGLRLCGPVPSDDAYQDSIVTLSYGSDGALLEFEFAVADGSSSLRSVSYDFTYAS